jgi:hypothetical protein
MSFHRGPSSQRGRGIGNTLGCLYRAVIPHIYHQQIDSSKEEKTDICNKKTCKKNVKKPLKRPCKKGKEESVPEKKKKVCDLFTLKLKDQEIKNESSEASEESESESESEIDSEEEKNE